MDDGQSACKLSSSNTRILDRGRGVGTRVDLREVFELHAAGLTRVITEVRSLETVNDSIEDVEAGRVPARVVFVP